MSIHTDYSATCAKLDLSEATNQRITGFLKQNGLGTDFIAYMDSKKFMFLQVGNIVICDAFIANIIKASKPTLPTYFKHKCFNPK